MCSRQWLTVFAACALAAAAVARPQSDNELSKSTNEISTKESVQIKPDDNRAIEAVTSTNSNPDLEAISNDTKAEAATAASVTTPEKESQTELIAPNADEANSVIVETGDSAKDVEVVDNAKNDFKEDANRDVLVAKAVNEQYPHAVLFGGTCGGSIISPNWVLTAGHCTLFSNGRYVVAGTNNTDEDNGVTRYVKRLVVHPRFSVGPYWLDADEFNIKQVAASWDFMLVELKDPLPLDGKIMAAVSLNEQATLPEGLEVGYAGYGAEHHGETMRSDMHAMELAVQADRTCQDALIQYEPEDMICTRGRPPRLDSACNGDSGSGLVANGTLYGVASWVENDAHSCFNGALVVFSRVSAVRDWIRQITRI